MRAFVVQQTSALSVSAANHAPLDESEHDGRCITVFSAPRYCDSTENKGAYINIGPDYKLNFEVFNNVPHPDIKPMACESSPPMPLASELDVAIRKSTRLTHSNRRRKQLALIGHDVDGRARACSGRFPSRIFLPAYERWRFWNSGTRDILCDLQSADLEIG